ncbi:DUF1145 domain-containing protein [Geopseudomonas guangdongensis]|uniref:Putative membrane protein n=1 Tax=Geopseudomonas guangdongensis TaxID=1245526 RepID=A0A1H2H7D3_9GAMM|nr:DUF1145 domain-containing protein [Pseudomonas guangdongensis]SDU27797.1 putative membrane protein [Pseudomonas guangdongensis]
MKLFNLLGSLSVAALWLALAGNLLRPFAAPFDLLLQLAAAGLLGLHLLQAWLYRRELGACARPWLATLGVLLCGAFRLPRERAAVAPLLRPQASRADAPAATPEPLRSAA